MTLVVSAYEVDEYGVLMEERSAADSLVLVRLTWNWTTKHGSFHMRNIRRTAVRHIRACVLRSIRRKATDSLVVKEMRKRDLPITMQDAMRQCWRGEQSNPTKRAKG
jgi:hypothetical protein